MKRFFFALDIKKCIDSITAACSQYSALKKVTHFATGQTTTDPLETIGSLFAADVMKRESSLYLLFGNAFPLVLLP